MNKRTTALLIDDDAKLAALVAEYLGQNDVDVTVAGDGERGLAALQKSAYDVVLLLETLLAFREKTRLLAEVAGVLEAGGRFAFTFEEGEPLTDAERAVMPHADTVWLTPLPELMCQLESTGFRVRWLADCSEAHHATADSLLNAYSADAREIVTQLGRPAFDDLLDAHVLWSAWLKIGRVRKFAVVAEKLSD